MPSRPDPTPDTPATPADPGRVKVFAAPVLKADAKARTTTAVISTDSVDRDGEVLLASGCILDHYKRNPVVCFVHDTRRLPVGKGDPWISPDARSVLMEATWVGGEIDPLGPQVAEAYAQDFMRGFSVGFKPVPGTFGPPTKDELLRRPEWSAAKCVYRQWELLEVSAVVVPANRDALKKAHDSGRPVPDFLKALSGAAGTSGGYTVADDKAKPADDEGGGDDMPKAKPGDAVRWDYERDGEKCSGMGKVKSCHAKGDDMPSMDDEGGDDGDKAATPKKPAACPFDGAKVKCYAMKGAKPEPTGKFEYHAHDKMTVLHDGLPGASEPATSGTEAKSARDAKAIRADIAKVAKTIKHVGDYGQAFHHEGQAAVHWTMADSDGGDGFDSSKEIEAKFKAIDGIKKVVIGDEWSPKEEDGWVKCYPVTSKSVASPIVKYMGDSPFCSPGWWPQPPREPFDGWQREASLRALESLLCRLQCGLCTVISSDVLDLPGKGDQAGQVIDAFRPAALRVIDILLGSDASEEATVKAAGTLAHVARRRAKAIEAPHRTPDDDAASAESFDQWFTALVSDAGELRDALAKRAEVRLKAGRVLSQATLSQINAAIEALASATDALTALRDAAAITKPTPEPAEGDAAKGDSAATGDPAAAAKLKSEAMRRRAELRRLSPATTT